jgi:hypothetical protein
MKSANHASPTSAVEMDFLDPTKAVMTETRTTVTVVHPLVISSLDTPVFLAPYVRKPQAFRFAAIGRLRMANHATTETS